MHKDLIFSSICQNLILFLIVLLYWTCFKVYLLLLSLLYPPSLLLPLSIFLHLPSLLLLIHRRECSRHWRVDATNVRSSYRHLRNLVHLLFIFSIFPSPFSLPDFFIMHKRCKEERRGEERERKVLPCVITHQNNPWVVTNIFVQVGQREVRWSPRMLEHR